MIQATPALEESAAQLVRSKEIFDQEVTQTVVVRTQPGEAEDPLTQACPSQVDSEANTVLRYGNCHEDQHTARVMTSHCSLWQGSALRKR